MKEWEPVFPEGTNAAFFEDLFGGQKREQEPFDKVGCYSESSLGSHIRCFGA